MDEIINELTEISESPMIYINNVFDTVLFEYTDSLYTNHYVTESEKESLITTIKKFFINLIESIKNYGRELSIKIDYVIREKKIKENLERLKREIISNKEKGSQYVEMIDYWNYKNKYLELNRKLTVYAKKMSKMNYNKTWEIEDDLEKFNIIIEDYSHIMEEASLKKIDVQIDKALEFVEDELRGKSEVLSTLNDSMRLFQDMNREAQMLESKLNKIGSDIIPKQANLLFRIANAISSFVKKFVTKFVMGVTFLFAI